ncbi:MAG: SPOR domain-containing protein [Thiothrix sp.]|nr:SPOR domain-containing protein [Thiothrix sp.]HPE61209.1 SPOR domain-containing protein [Thiolinea sp.]
MKQQIRLILTLSATTLLISACSTTPTSQPDNGVMPYGSSYSGNIPEAGPLDGSSSVSAYVPPQSVPTPAPAAYAPTYAPTPVMAQPQPQPMPVAAAPAPAAGYGSYDSYTGAPAANNGGYDNYANTAPAPDNTAYNNYANTAPAPDNTAYDNNYAGAAGNTGYDPSSSYNSYGPVPGNTPTYNTAPPNNYSTPGYDYSAPNSNTAGNSYYTGGDTYAGGGSNYSSGSAGGSSAVQVFATVSQDKAQRLQQDLRSQGLNAVVDRVDGLFKVRVPFGSESEARSNLARVRSLSGESGAFVTSRS